MPEVYDSGIHNDTDLQRCRFSASERVEFGFDSPPGVVTVSRTGYLHLLERNNGRNAKTPVVRTLRCATFGTDDRGSATAAAEVDQLAPAVDGEKVIVELKDASSLKGVVTSVESDALSLRVTSSSHPRYKKGTAAIPRGEIAGLRFSAGEVGHRTLVGALVGLGIGLGAGIPMIVKAKPQGPPTCGPPIFFAPECAYPRQNNALMGAGISVMLAPSAVGALIGRHLDRSNGSPITLLPD